MVFSKRAVSLMVSYTVLVVIAVSLSALVYLNLEKVLPRDVEECTDEVQVLIKSVDECFRPSSPPTSKGTLALTVENRGRFNAEALFVRIGKKDLSNRGLQQANRGLERLPSPLKPGEARQIRFESTVSDEAIPESGEYTVEIQTAEVVSTSDGPILAPCNTRISLDASCTVS